MMKVEEKSNNTSTQHVVVVLLPVGEAGLCRLGRHLGQPLISKALTPTTKIVIPHRYASRCNSPG